MIDITTATLLTVYLFPILGPQLSEELGHALWEAVRRAEQQALIEVGDGNITFPEDLTNEEIFRQHEEAAKKLHELYQVWQSQSGEPKYWSYADW